jgi:hypothetical protein
MGKMTKTMRDMVHEATGDETSLIYDLVRKICSDAVHCLIRVQSLTDDDSIMLTIGFLSTLWMLRAHITATYESTHEISDRIWERMVDDAIADLENLRRELKQ